MGREPRADSLLFIFVVRSDGSVIHRVAVWVTKAAGGCGTAGAIETTDDLLDIRSGSNPFRQADIEPIRPLPREPPVRE